MSIDTVITSLLTALLTSGILTALINHKSQMYAIKESGLYAKRASIIDEIMQRLERLNRTTEDLIAPLQIDNSSKAIASREQKVLDAYQNFKGYYKDHVHYLNPNLVSEIDIILNMYVNMFITHRISLSNDSKSTSKKWKELFDYYNDKNFIDKRNDVISEFRKMIGVK